MIKHQVFQTMTNFQITSSKHFGELKIGYWNLFVSWNLDLGIYQK